MHPGSIEYTQRVLAWSILLDVKDRGLVEIFPNEDRSFCLIKLWVRDGGYESIHNN